MAQHHHHHTVAGHVIARDIFDRHEDPDLMQGGHDDEDEAGDDDGNDDGNDNDNPQQRYQQQQQLLAPRYRGVSYEKRKNLWRARLYCRGQHTTLGRYSTARMAATAHDKAACFVFGERAVTNFGAQTVDLPLPFGRTVNIKLAGLRDMMRRNHQSAPGLPNEEQARAMRMAAAAAAFLPPSAAGAAAAGAGGRLLQAPPPAPRPLPPPPPPRPPRLQQPAAAIDWAGSEHQLSGEVLAAITLASGGGGGGAGMMFSPFAASGGGGGMAAASGAYAAAAAAYGDADAAAAHGFEDQGEEDAWMAAADEQGRGQGAVARKEQLPSPGQQQQLLQRSAWQALILAAATCSPGVLPASGVAGGRRRRRW